MSNPYDDPANAADALDPAVDRRLLLTGLAGAAVVAALASMAKAGPLTPPGGPITSTPGPEPRIAVNAQNTPPSASSLLVISQPGSYYLTGNVQGVSGRNGILIAASNVTLDLNGFTVQGVAGTGDGIVAAGVNNVTVCNGVSRGWSASGVTFFGGAFNCVVRNVTATNNTTGIFVSTSGQITDCIASNNTGSGIIADNNVLITRCVALSNAVIGIQGFTTCLIADCLSAGNSRGIDVQNSCTVARCTLASNAAEGLRANISNTITDCTVRASNLGIRLIANSGEGLNRVERNSVASCGTSFLVESGLNFLAGNTSGLAALNHWNIAAGNYINAAIAAGMTAFTGNSGGAPVTGTANDPYMNFTIA